MFNVPTKCHLMFVGRVDNGKIFVGDFAVAGTGAAYTRRNKGCQYECVVGCILNALIYILAARMEKEILIRDR